MSKNQNGKTPFKAKIKKSTSTEGVEPTQVQPLDGPARYRCQAFAANSGYLFAAKSKLSLIPFDGAKKIVKGNIVQPVSAVPRGLALATGTAYAVECEVFQSFTEAWQALPAEAKFELGKLKALALYTPKNARAFRSGGTDEKNNGGWVVVENEKAEVSAHQLPARWHHKSYQSLDKTHPALFSALGGKL